MIWEVFSLLGNASGALWFFFIALWLHVRGGRGSVVAAGVFWTCGAHHALVAFVILGAEPRPTLHAMVALIMGVWAWVASWWIVSRGRLRDLFVFPKWEP